MLKPLHSDLCFLTTFLELFLFCYYKVLNQIKNTFPDLQYFLMLNSIKSIHDLLLSIIPTKIWLNTQILIFAFSINHPNICSATAILCEQIWRKLILRLSSTAICLICIQWWIFVFFILKKSLFLHTSWKYLLNDEKLLIDTVLPFV